MGIDDSQWESARQLQDLLQALHQQREKNITAKRGDYQYAAHKMFFWTFYASWGACYDRKRKCMWCLGWKVSFHAQTVKILSITDLQQGPTEPEDPTLDVQANYHITQSGPYLKVYTDPKGLPSKCVAKYNMLEPRHRQAFLDVRRWVTKRYPPSQQAAPPKHRDLRRVQNM